MNRQKAESRRRVARPAGDAAVEEAARVGKRLGEIRLSRNVTQQALAEEAGVSTRTLTRLESGSGASFDTIVRVMKALDLEVSLFRMLPDPRVQPKTMIEQPDGLRRRASAVRSQSAAAGWTWDDDDEG